MGHLITRQVKRKIVYAQSQYYMFIPAQNVDSASTETAGGTIPRRDTNQLTMLIVSKLFVQASAGGSGMHATRDTGNTATTRSSAFTATFSRAVVGGGGRGDGGVCFPPLFEAVRHSLSCLVPSRHEIAGSQ